MKTNQKKPTMKIDEKNPATPGKCTCWKNEKGTVLENRDCPIHGNGGTEDIFTQPTPPETGREWEKGFEKELRRQILMGCRSELFVEVAMGMITLLLLSEQKRWEELMRRKIIEALGENENLDATLHEPDIAIEERNKFRNHIRSKLTDVLSFLKENA